ncbi:hypothetical protein JCM10449v2_000545 [Rhodotorula kratochvilovae]
MPLAPFDLLPDELVLAIVELVARDPEDAARSRAANVRRICLVARRFRRLAQPGLWRDVCLESGPRLGAFEQNTPQGLADVVRMVELIAHRHGLEEAALQRLLRMVPSVEQVKVACLCMTAGDVKVFEETRNLTRLAFLDSSGGLSATTPFRLPHLQRFDYWADDDLPPRVFRSLSPSSVPALRVLVLEGVEPDLADAFDPMLLPQLEFIQADWAFAARFEEVARPRSRVVVLAGMAVCELMDASILPAPLGDARIRHLSIFQFGVTDVMKLMDLTLDRCTSLETLSLSREVQTASAPGEVVQVERLVKCASDRHIKIIWNDTRMEHCFDEAFYEYAKKLRARAEV